MLESWLKRIQVQGRINGRANARPIDSSIYIYIYMNQALLVARVELVQHNEETLFCFSRDPRVACGLHYEI